MLSKQLIKLFINTHVLLYRFTGGKLGGSMSGMPVLLLTTTGRKSGKQRTIPLVYLSDGETYVVMASNNGQDRHPGWWFNLQSRPQVTIQAKGVQRNALAEEATPDEKSRLWPELIEKMPAFEGYQKKTTRQIPMVILRDASDAAF